jgi:hypothetical protein
MRTFLMLCLVALITGSAYAQKDLSDVIGAKTEKITEVNSSRNSLWINAHTWANAVSTQFEKRIDTEDKESGTMILTIEANIPTEAGMNEYSKIKATMNLKIDCRENKYRSVFSNFTASISPDRNVNVDYLTEKQLDGMVQELNRVAQLSEKHFNQKMLWGIDDILSVKDNRIKQVNDYEQEITMLDAESKKGKKEINKRQVWIKLINEREIAYLDCILTGFGKIVSTLQEDIDKNMNVSDDF